MSDFFDRVFAYFLTPRDDTSHWTVRIERKQGKIFTFFRSWEKTLGIWRNTCLNFFSFPFGEQRKLPPEYHAAALLFYAQETKKSIFPNPRHSLTDSHCESHRVLDVSFEPVGESKEVRNIFKFGEKLFFIDKVKKGLRLLGKFGFIKFWEHESDISWIAFCPWKFSSAYLPKLMGLLVFRKLCEALSGQLPNEGDMPTPLDWGERRWDSKEKEAYAFKFMNTAKYPQTLDYPVHKLLEDLNAERKEFVYLGIAYLMEKGIVESDSLFKITKRAKLFFTDGWVEKAELLFGIRLSLFYRWWQSYPRSFDIRFVPSDRN